MKNTQQNISAKTWQPSLFDDLSDEGFIDSSEIPDAVIDRQTIDQFDINAHEYRESLMEFPNGIDEFENRRRVLAQQGIVMDWLAELNISLN